MAQWYCYAGGQQYGPIAEEVLKQWIYDRRVKPSDLVWTDGMANWAPASSVPSLSAAAPGTIPPPIVHVPMVDAHPPGGTGGATPNAQLTAQARQALRGRWGLPIGFCLVLWLIQAAIGGVGSFTGIPVGMIIAGPFMLSYCIFFLTFNRGGQADLNMLFAGFKNFGNALGAYILMMIFVFLWMLLLIIPGIIAGLAYSQTFYLLADDRSLGPLEAIRKSKEMMRGYKWKLFCLGLRFFGWSLLCILTLGIGFLWLMPYMNTAYALFYDDLRQPRDAAVPAPDSASQGALPPSA
ncbi:MAG TPA: DUF975 family protein [Phycisphaerae bacterium]|nr:DUF975 family protein [Phycisphaerae bacterium]HUT57483.1 DUF975 family protein [Phycisphaerae bacterium]